MSKKGEFLFGKGEKNGFVDHVFLHSWELHDTIRTVLPTGIDKKSPFGAGIL